MARGTKRKPKEEEPDPDEEFEVDRIVMHRGPRTKREFLVKWIGYSAADNSWVEEEGLAGCTEILKAYWDLQSQKEAKAKEAKMEEIEKPVPKPVKRASTSKRRALADPESEDGIDGATENPEVDVEDPEAAQRLLEKYMKLDDWDTKINNVMTVMREASGDLRFYVIWTDGEKSWVDEELMNTRASQHVIQFYKSHLKFKSHSK